MTSITIGADGVGSPLSTQRDMVRERSAFFRRIRETFELANEQDKVSTITSRWGITLPEPPVASAWTSMPHRGWLVIDSEANRPYVISIWQVGKWLRIGVKLQPHIVHAGAWMQQPVSEIFYDTPCHVTARGDGYFFDWFFEVPNLYVTMVEQETWIMAILHLYEMIGVLLATGNNHEYVSVAGLSRDPLLAEQVVHEQ